MRPQIFNIKDFKSGAFRTVNYIGKANQFSSGENTLRQEERLRPTIHGLRPDDSMIHEKAAVGQQPVNLVEIALKLIGTDMLEHSYGSDLLKRTGEFLIIAFQDAHPLNQIPSLYFTDGPRSLFGTKSASRAQGAVSICAMYNERSPAAADVEEAIARTKLQFPANMFELIELSRFKRRIPRLEIGAGIHHSGIEKIAIKLIRAIVVKSDIATGGAVAELITEPV
jgi:hypothetical protein